MSIEYSYLISAEDWRLEQILEIHDFNLYDVNDRHPDYYMQTLLDQTEAAYKKIDSLSRDIEELFSLTKNNSKIYFNHSEADEPKHSPQFLQTWTGGPWNVEFPESSLAEFNGGYSITVPRSEIVLEDESDDEQDEDKPKTVTLCKVEGAKALKSERIANVALIASAPELANTLIEILRNHENDGSKTHLCEQDQELVTALLTKVDQMIGQGRATLDQP